MINLQTAVVLFAYNRPKHFEATLTSALAELRGKEYKWYVFIDGPNFSSDDSSMLEILSISKRLLKEEEFECNKQPINIGLKSSIILGVTEVFKRHEQAIILEDDLEVRPGFGEFFVNAFEKYKDEKIVVQISAYSHVSTGSDSAYSLPFINSWGWGTWKDRWDEFVSLTLNTDLTSDLTALDLYLFDYNNSYSFSRILKKQIKGKVSSWAILFYLHTFKFQKIAVYPPESLVVNKGFDGSGTHGSLGLNSLQKRNLLTSVNRIVLPPIESLTLSSETRIKVETALKKMSRKARAIKYIKGLLYELYGSSRSHFN